MSSLLKVGLALPQAAMIVAAVSAFAVWSQFGAIDIEVGGREERERKKWAMPGGDLLTIAAMCFVVYLAEGGVLD